MGSSKHSKSGKGTMDKIYLKASYTESDLCGRKNKEERAVEYEDNWLHIVNDSYDVIHRITQFLLITIFSSLLVGGYSFNSMQSLPSSAVHSNKVCRNCYRETGYIFVLSSIRMKLKPEVGCRPSFASEKKARKWRWLFDKLITLEYEWAKNTSDLPGSNRRHQDYRITVLRSSNWAKVGTLLRGYGICSTQTLLNENRKILNAAFTIAHMLQK